MLSSHGNYIPCSAPRNDAHPRWLEADRGFRHRGAAGGVAFVLSCGGVAFVQRVLIAIIPAQDADTHLEH
eukprot:481880-Prymnesium_polylepis.2